MSTQTAKELANILSLQLEETIEPDQDVSMNNHPKWDSLKQIEIIMCVEEFFKISLEPSEIPKLTSQALLLRSIEHLLNKA